MLIGFLLLMLLLFLGSRCVSEPKTFEQEGWHYELEDPKDDLIFKVPFPFRKPLLTMCARQTAILPGRYSK